MTVNGKEIKTGEELLAFIGLNFNEGKDGRTKNDFKDNNKFRSISKDAGGQSEPLFPPLS
jgi:hypothetical protein